MDRSGTDDGTLDLLARGELEVVGRLVEASNATLLATVSLDGVQTACVYKPMVGERPLWDYPTRTLYRREVAAYLVSAAGGWDVVPPTVLRTDGPAGPGSVQRWLGGVPPEGEAPEPGAGVIDVVRRGALPEGWLSVFEAEHYDGSPVVLGHADDPQLRAMAVFDLVVDNADRKGGHVLRDGDGRLQGVDHGLTFNTEDKLRTVLWGWAGHRLDDADLAPVRRLARALDADAADDPAAPAAAGSFHPGPRDGVGDLREQLATLLAPEEIERTRQRVQWLLERRRFPRPSGRRPAIPWPPF